MVKEKLKRICKEIIDSHKEEIGNFQKTIELIENNQLTTEQAELNYLVCKLIQSHKKKNELLLRKDGYGYGPLSSRDERYRTLLALQNNYLNSKERNKIKFGYNVVKIAMGLGEWKIAIKIFNNIMNQDSWESTDNEIKASVYNDLGVSMTKLNRDAYIQFLDGRKFFKKAEKLNGNNSNILASIAGSWKDFNDDEAYKYYKKALEVNPDDPYPLGNVIIYEIMKKRDFRLEDHRISDLKKAIKIRKEHIKNFKDIPWTYYDIGTFSLLLGDYEQALNYFLMAIRFSHDEWMIETTLKTLDKIKVLHDKIKGIYSIRVILLLGIAINLKRKKESKKKLFNTVIEELRKMGLQENRTQMHGIPIIFAGGINPEAHVNLTNYFNNFKEAFRNKNGCIICGCPAYNCIDFLSAIKKVAPNINVLLYVPEIKSSTYSELNFSLYKTNRENFSPTEIFQYWFDIINSDVDPNQIKLIGIAGHVLSFFEYRLAIALGAHLGLVKDTGGAVSDLLNNPLWEEIIEDRNNLTKFRLYTLLENSSKEIKDFLESKCIKELDNENIKCILIQHRDGMTIFHKDVLKVPISKILLSSILSAIFTLGKKLNVSELKKFEYEGLIVKPKRILHGKILIIFLLLRNPSPTLESKIDFFTKSCEDLYGSDLLKIESGEVMPKEKIERLLANIFGHEIL